MGDPLKLATFDALLNRKRKALLAEKKEEKIRDKNEPLLTKEETEAEKIDREISDARETIERERREKAKAMLLRDAVRTSNGGTLPRSRPDTNKEFLGRTLESANSSHRREDERRERNKEKRDQFVSIERDKTELNRSKYPEQSEHEKELSVDKKSRRELYDREHRRRSRNHDDDERRPNSRGDGEGREKLSEKRSRRSSRNEDDQKESNRSKENCEEKEHHKNDRRKREKERHGEEKEHGDNAGNSYSADYSRNEENLSEEKSEHARKEKELRKRIQERQRKRKEEDERGNNARGTEREVHELGKAKRKRDEGEKHKKKSFGL